jgi:succinate dehydrogenase / fumarate reductase membrane anchor subunit
MSGPVHDKAGLRTPLSRARGLGAAHAGAHHWIAERVSSVALVPLSLWAIWAALKIAPQGYDGAVALLSSPFNAVAALLLLAVSFQHMKIGLQVVIEDYVHVPFNKVALLLLNSAVCWTAWAAASFSILMVALKGGGAL